MNCSDEFIGEDGQIYKITSFIDKPSAVFVNKITGETMPRCAVDSPAWKKYTKIKIQGASNERRYSG